MMVSSIKMRLFSLFSSLLILTGLSWFKNPLGQTYSIEGVDTQAENFFPALVAGSGVGGLVASMYLAQSGLKVGVVDGPMQGGLLTQSYAVTNWPGEKNIPGADLINKMRDHAQSAGALFLSTDQKPLQITSVNTSSFPYRVMLATEDGSTTVEVTTLALIIASGTTPRKLAIAGEEKYWGKGVSNCAVCDGRLYKDRTVAVVGGGDAAVLEVEYLSTLAKKIYWLVRGNKLRAHDNNHTRAVHDLPNVEVMYQSSPQEINGNDDGVTEIIVRDLATKDEKTLAVDGVFLAIGSIPNSQPFASALNLDSVGHIEIDAHGQTSVQGVYALGDVTKTEYKQATMVAGTATQVALDAYHFIRSTGYNAAMTSQKACSVQNLITASKKQHVTELACMPDFQQQLKENKYVVLDCYAEWCPPCRVMKPIFHKIAKLSEFEQIKFCAANVDTCEDIAQKYGVKGIPCFFFFADGEIKKRLVGSKPQEAFVEELRTFLANKK